MQINLSPTPQFIQIESAALLYIERHGPFMKSAPQAWKEFHALTSSRIPPENIVSMAGLSRIDDGKTGDVAFIYQAGVILKAPPAFVPEGTRLRTLAQGKYAVFLLTGPYAQLPQAYPAVFAILEHSAVRLRREFYIERYLNHPGNAPEAELKTEIVIPVE